jgi:predicted RNase H-like HicB family nuclease
VPELLAEEGEVSMSQEFERALAAAMSPSRTITWTTPAGTCYRCEVVLEPEPDGGFSVFASDLPGAASQGATEEDALTNIVESLTGAIASYKAHNEPIPWSRPEEELSPLAKIRWVFVNA